MEMKKVYGLLLPLLLVMGCNSQNISGAESVTFQMFVRDSDNDEIVCRVAVESDGAFKGLICKVDPLLSPCGKSCFFLELTIGVHVILLQKEGYVTLTDTIAIRAETSGMNYFMQKIASGGSGAFASSKPLAEGSEE